MKFINSSFHQSIILCFVSLLAAIPVLAGRPGFGDRKYSLTAMGEYSYNTVWGHHGNLDFKALLPFNQHFEMEAKLQFSTANVHTATFQFRPKFELPVGEMFIETDLFCKLAARNRMSDLDAALAVGYRMDYVSVTLGISSRVMIDWDRDWHTNDTYVVEPFNLLYRIEVFCRPQNNPWNLSFLFSNTDDFQMERMWQPLFGIGAWCDLVEDWRLNFGVQCKPTGMFHLDATFYGATLRVGATYRF